MYSKFQRRYSDCADLIHVRRFSESQTRRTTTMPQESLPEPEIFDQPTVARSAGSNDATTLPIRDNSLQESPFGTRKPNAVTKAGQDHAS